MWFDCRTLFSLEHFNCPASIEFKGKADTYGHYCKHSKRFPKALGLVVENICLNTLLKCLMKKLTRMLLKKHYSYFSCLMYNRLGPKLVTTISWEPVRGLMK